MEENNEENPMEENNEENPMEENKFSEEETKRMAKELDSWLDIARRFEKRELNEHGAQALRKNQLQFTMMAIHLYSTLPDGRYKSLALTSLEETFEWASKAISHDGGYEIETTD